MAFKQATRRQGKLRMGLAGPSGSGKTYTALAIATALARGGKVAVIDTERGSASKYAGGKPFHFDVDEPTTFDPATIPPALREAAREGYSVVVIDSLSHYWMGTGGALELHDLAEKKSGGKKTSFTAWSDVTPVQTAMIDAILQAPMHVIVTMRTKTEWVLEQNDKGRTVPRKVGMAPVQRAGLEYEFDVMGDLDDSNTMTLSKTRCSAIAGRAWVKPGEQLAETLLAWLSDGAPATAPTPPAPPAAAAAPAPAPTTTEAPSSGPVEEAKALIDFAAKNGIDAMKAMAADLKPFCDRAGKDGDAEIRAYFIAARSRVAPAQQPQA